MRKILRWLSGRNAPELNVYRTAAAERLRVDPKDPDAQFARAAFLAAERKLGEAVESLNVLARVAPGYPGLWRFKARLYAEVGEEKLARLCAERGQASL